MNDRKNYNYIVHDAVRDNVWQSGDDQFAGSFDSSRTPALRELLKLISSVHHGSGNPRSGGGNSFPVPQLRNHWTTFS
jgi:hypothetical protein